MAGEWSSSRTYSASFSNDIVVGVNDKLDSIKDRLTGYPSKLEVLSIVGMGGIGKTTLARKIYDDPLIVDYFYVRAWTSLSQKYELVDILLDLIQEFCQGGITKIDDLESSRDVGAQLWQALKGQRFLVVIDDIWDVEAWKDLRIFFPNDRNGSRIILTGRNVDVAKYANPQLAPYELSLMDPETSWELLSKKVFFRDSCPEELVPIGNAIALKCQGLPLAINVVAGHLSKVGRTYPDWHNMEKNLPSMPGNVLDILALSYNYLPVHLQKCFLFAANEYAELFIPNDARLLKAVNENAQLSIRNHARLLQAVNENAQLSMRNDARLLKAVNENAQLSMRNHARLLEAVNENAQLFMRNNARLLKVVNENAQVSMRNDARLLKAVNEYAKLSMRPDARLLKFPKTLQDIRLVGKSSTELLNVQFSITTKKLMSLWIAAGYIHEESPRSLEYVAEECLQELASRNLIILTNKGYRGIPTCYIVHDLLIDMYSRLDGRTVIRRNGWKEPMRGQWFEPQLAKLHCYSHDIYPFAIYGGHHILLQSIQESFHLSKWVHLKHLEISASSIPTSVYKLPNLQTLINAKAFSFVTLPRDIWMMSQLRHLHVGDSTYLPSPRLSHTKELSIPILKNLQSVTLSSSSCSREICEGIPNLRRLKLYEIGECNVEEQSVNCLNNLYVLAQLQSLRLRLDDPPRCLEHWKSPPPNLRKLTLEGTRLGREDTMILASLPNLEVLKLRYKYFEMDRWALEHDNDIFHKLRLLVIECLRLELWEASSNNFPNLQHLVLSNCNYLERIPLEMGEICTLQVIELYNCRQTVEESAREIQQKQCDMGNEDFKVHITRLNYKNRQS